ncbi:MAG: hypothetical protein HY021_00435 [Burkholderiales bacterium]|nr:hypothetical protein [Burkholderiales bacterium]
MKTVLAVSICLALAACATQPDRGTAAPDAAGGMRYSSAECLAAKLAPVDPFPASAIPQAAMNNRQSGWVAIRYDVVAGVAQNLVVVGSHPAGLYDEAAMQHVARFRDPAMTFVRGCVTTIDVKF